MVLRKRYKRNIKSNLGFYISVMVLTAVSIMVYLTMACGLEGMEGYLDDFKKECVAEDAQFTSYLPLDDSQISGFEEKYDLLLEKQSYIDIENGGDTIRLFKASEKVNIYRVTDGDDVAADDEILLSASYMENNDIEIGDSYTLGGKEYKITGTYDRPDYLYILKELKGSFATPETFGIAMLTESEYSNVYSKLADDEVSYYSVKYHGSDVDAFRRELNDTVMVSAYVNNENNNRISTADATLDMTRDIKDVIIPIIFVLIIIIIAVVLERKIKSEQKLIGILSALGYTKTQLALHYSVFGAFAALLGSILGVICAIPMENVLIPMAFVKLESFPVEYGLSAANVAVAFIVPLLCFTVTVFLTAMAVMRKETISMINGTDDRKRRTAFRMEKSKLGFAAKYRIRSIFGKPARTFIILAGVCIGSLVFLYTYGVVDSLKVYVDDSINKMGDLEYQYYFNELRTDEPEDGVKVVYSNFECGKDDIAVTLMGMETNDLLSCKLVSGGEADLESGGYYITRMGATIYGVDEGDELVLKNIASLEKTTIKIEGLIENDSQNAIYTSPENVYEITGLPEGCYNLLLSEDDMGYADGELRQIITKSSLREQIEEVYELVKSEVGIMIPFGVVICVFVIYIMVNMLISENKSSISMLKVLGYKDKEINRIVINVYHFVIPAAALLGLVAGYLFIKFFFIANTAAYNTYVEAHFSVLTVIKYFILVFLSYAVSLVILGRKVGKVEMSESLKDNRE